EVSFLVNSLFTLYYTGSYIFCYLGAIWCGLMFCRTSGDMYEKRRDIKERPGFALAAAVLFLAGLYLESVVHPVWLKSFLKVF
ncbi:MAG: hypothetical protein LUC90_05195, partial [Lachnospiraceae bacterium]|nr:hypothetical protein [Lachnospiraceae bacterium]